MNYRDWLKALSPGFLRGYWGERLIGQMGVMYDSLAAGAQLAVSAGWPIQKSDEDLLPLDALRWAGLHRNMPRHLGESNVDYQARLGQAWATWQNAGKPAEILNQLSLYGLTNVTLIPAYSTASPASWSVFWAIIQAPHPWASVAPTDAEVIQIRNIMRKWKSGEEICRSFSIVRSGPVWNVNMTWNSFTWSDGAGVLTYSG